MLLCTFLSVRAARVAYAFAIWGGIISLWRSLFGVAPAPSVLTTVRLVLVSLRLGLAVIVFFFCSFLSFFELFCPLLCVFWGTWASFLRLVERNEVQ